MTEILDQLNAAQQLAVTSSTGPVMVIAGAGSGKTRVLTYRIAYMLSQGVDPFNILALTFTNKAAREMKSRIMELVGTTEGRNVWMGTFHSIFARILRIEGHVLGYPSNFTIYDTDDSKSVIKAILKDLNLDPKQYPLNTVLSRISAAKSNLISAAEYNANAELLSQDSAAQKPMIGEIYSYYDARCFRAGAMDFETAVQLVYKRGNYMQNTVPIGEGGMLALLGCTDEEAIAFCKDITLKYGLLEPANFNYPGQIVAGGKSIAIDNAIDKAPQFNIKKAVKLQVSAPFHTSMLKPAGDKLKEDLSKIKFKKPVNEVISNVDTVYYEISKMAEKLEKQVYNPVRWEACVRKMIADGVNTFVEIGPGKTLSGFIKRIDRNVKSINIENVQGLNTYLQFAGA